jgi:hypothetical protein
MRTTRFSTLGFCLFATLFLSGCAVGNKIQYSGVSAQISASGSHTIPSRSTTNSSDSVDC